jgi:hypothetical protein
MSMPYKVGKYPGVAEKMRTLADLASLAGLRQSYLDALRKMADHLENDPLEWGDPVYRVPHQSGVVCHALVEPVVVHYSVHESTKIVLIIDIKPMFEWPIRP